MMTESQFEVMWDRGELDDEYADYIFNNSAGDRWICNGDQLITAMEDGYLFESFKESMVRDPSYEEWAGNLDAKQPMTNEEVRNA